MNYLKKYSSKAKRFDGALTLASSTHLGNDQFYAEDGDERANEIRANWGEAGILLACPDFAAGNGIYTDVKDALGNIAHFCDRAGLDPHEIFEAGLRGYEGDMEDGPKAARDEQTYPEEVQG